MALEFLHVKLLKYSHRPVFFEAGLRYRIEKKLTITGRVADPANIVGVASLFEKEGRVLAAANDYDDIVLNGVSFGSGRIENISFEGGIMVRDEDYTYDIVCYEDGNLFNALDDVYQGLSWTDAKNIEELSESFEFQDDERGDLTYSHSIDVRFSAYTSVDSGTNKAKALAAIFFNATSGLGAFLGTYTDIGTAKRLHSESYSLIDCSCSFTESVVIPKIRVGNYSYSLSYSVEQGEDGFVTVSEKCDIKGLTSPRHAGALEGLAALSVGARTRCDTIYGQYGFSSSALCTSPLQKGVSINKFTGDISIEVTFSNDPRYRIKSTWEYTLEAQKDSQNYYTITESGSIRGYGRPLLDKYANAQSFYATVQSTLAARVATFYTLVSGRSLSLIKISESKAQNEYEGTIQYSNTYTDNNLFSSGDIRKTEATITTAKPVHLVQKYNIFNQKEVIQTQQQSTLGSISYQIALKGKRGTALSTYLTAAKAIVSTNLPGTTERFIESAQYEFSPRTNDFSLSLTLKYVGAHKELADITID